MLDKRWEKGERYWKWDEYVQFGVHWSIVGGMWNERKIMDDTSILKCFQVAFRIVFQ